MTIKKRLQKQRQRRTWRVRNKARRSGRPRLTVFRSNKHIYAQIIDDTEGKTLCAASSVESDLADDGRGNDTAAATRVGAALAERAKEQGLQQVTFDRGAYRFHGRVAALAAAARENGLKF